MARLGGDEFGLLLPDLDTRAGALPVVERIRAELERPIDVHSLPLTLEASIGIAIFPDHGADAQVLIQRADVAMCDSRRESAPFTFYDEPRARHGVP